jgi:hypothetical protein
VLSKIRFCTGCSNGRRDPDWQSKLGCHTGCIHVHSVQAYRVSHPY